MNLIKPAIFFASIAALIILITANVSPMEKNYDEKWKKVDSLVNLRQPRTALELVEEIYKSAKKEENTAQVIKSTLYRIKLTAEFEEDHLVKTISELEQTLSHSAFPEKELLHSITGDLYMRYFQMNRFQLLERGRIENFESDDISTWDAHALIKKAGMHFDSSLLPAENLQKIDLSSFSAILDEKKDSKLFRPTLYDFLAHSAIDFYSSSAAGITNAADQWKPDKTEYFAASERFCTLEIPEEKAHTQAAKIVKIYQDLIKFHLTDKDPQALIDVELQRLNWVKNNIVIENPNGHYFNALNSFKQRYNDSPHSANIAFELARYHNMIASGYNPHAGDEFRWERKKAVDICAETIKLFPSSIGAQNCRTLMNEITKPELRLQTEFAIVPQKAVPGLIHWKNYNRIHFRLLCLDYQQYKNLAWRTPAADLAEKLVNIPASQTWSVEIPNEMDFQDHSSEFKIPALAQGFYVLLASGDEHFSTKEAEIAWADFWVTGLTFTSQRKDDGSYDFYVLDRETGSPVKNATVQAFTRDYDFQSRQYTENLYQTIAADSEGFFKLSPITEKQSKSVFLRLTAKNDTFSPSTAFHLGPVSDKKDKTEQRTFFFTDRAIYRPGQTVYFKGIIVEKTGRQQQILAGQSTRIEFFDVNYRIVSSLELTTNDFGAVNGSFVIPSGVLNGQMTIRNNSGSTVIAVEDYKRPTFEVNFEPMTGSYKINSELTVQGTARGFAGNNIDGAKVKYRVIRKSYFPFRWIYSKRYYPDSPETEILSGETTTDKNGNFFINFTALPDRNLDRTYKPVFQYTVHASVTDISGETQAGEENISAGYEALFLNVNIPEKVDRKTKEQFIIHAANFNGVNQQTDVKVEIQSLKDPGKLMIHRLWDEPDIHLTDKQTYTTDFPGRVYDNENDPSTWESIATVFEKTFDTKSDTLLSPDNFNSWKPGKYVIKLSAIDVFGNPVETKKYFTLFDPDDRRPPLTEINWFTPLKSSGEPGEEAAFLLGTAARNIKALYEIQHQGKTISRQWINLDREQKLIKIPIFEEYRGNFSAHITFVYAGREFSNLMIITVPYTNKELDLAFETFRSQIEPGSNEKWKVTIRNKKGDQVAAQLLASMYDASLDQFIPHNWSFALYHPDNHIIPWQSFSNFSVSRGSSWNFGIRQYSSFIFNEYDQLNWFGFGGYGYDIFPTLGEGSPKSRMAAQNELSMQMDSMEEKNIEDQILMTEPQSGEQFPEKPKQKQSFNTVQLRRNFNETAFFYPELQTNEKGEVIISFTLPESLTRWRFMGLAHTKDLMTGQLEKEFTASKKLMVLPNSPRFFRAGDTLHFSAKISNLSGDTLRGNAEIDFFDGVTMTSISTKLQHSSSKPDFRVEAGQSTSVSWKIIIPDDLGVIVYRIKATAGNYSDGEEKAIPVLPGRMLVTESLPMSVNGQESRNFHFQKLLDSEKSTTLKHHQLTLEFSSNPAWYALQALPVISEPTFKNAMSVFAAFYANSIAFHIINDNEQIKRVFENWKSQTPETFLSNLEKNQELKALLLEQTPWILQARNEAERKQRIALLFDLNTMQNRLDDNIRILQKMQTPNGGFTWFEGMPESRYITQNILEGLGKLHKMKIIDGMNDDRVNKIINQSVRYLDERIREDYQNILKFNKDKMEENHLSPTQIQFLYARSFFPEIMINPHSETAFNYFRIQSSKFWQNQNNYLQGMIAIALHRYGEHEVPELILKSLKERSLRNSEMGMYWKTENGFLWYQAPVETQAMMIEAFDEAGHDPEAIEQMKIWLLRQKQTQDWKTSRATVEAVYALLQRGTHLLNHTNQVEIEIAGERIEMKNVGHVEAGTGYFQTSWSAGEITPEMGNISVKKTDNGIAWGAVYWQYFEDLDKITSHETPLSINKILFVERNRPSGTSLEQINDHDKLQIGDKVIVRIELRVDRDMEYVHLQDMRAAAFEPLNVLSGYKYKSGLGYYETTRDAGTHFFFDYIRKGTYVFEYPLITSQKGQFSNGISTIQCMYAPEFSSHSKGIRIKVE